MSRAARKPRQYRWALWWGLAIWAAGLTAAAIIGESEDNDISINLPLWMEAILACLIMPVLEELAFRLWATRKRWAAVAGPLLAALFVWSATQWWLGLAVLGGMYFCLFALRDERVRVTAMIAFSSASFACLHFGNHFDITPATVAAITSHFGFAMVACYLVLNFGFLWAILMHIVNNAVAYIALWVVIQTWSVEIKTDRYTLLAKHSESSIELTCDDLLIRSYGGTPAAFAHMLATESDNAADPLTLHYYDIYRSQHQDVLRFKLYDSQFGQPNDFIPVIKALCTEGHLGIDTLYEPALRLVVSDTALLQATRPATPPESMFGVNLRDLEFTLQSRMRIPVLAEHDWNDTCYISHRSDIAPMAYGNPDTARMSAWLSEHGLKLVPTEDDTMRIIWYKSL